MIFLSSTWMREAPHFQIFEAGGAGFFGVRCAHAGINRRMGHVVRLHGLQAGLLLRLGLGGVGFRGVPLKHLVLLRSADSELGVSIGLVVVTGLPYWQASQSGSSMAQALGAWGS